MSTTTTAAEQTMYQRGNACPERSRRVQTLQRDCLMRRIGEAARALKSYFGARRVLLFGSLADGDRFSPDSDVDLAAEGLDPLDYWQAWWLSEEIIEDRPVDLVPVERANDQALRAIEQRGLEL